MLTELLAGLISADVYNSAKRSLADLYGSSELDQAIERASSKLGMRDVGSDLSDWVRREEFLEILDAIYRGEWENIGTANDQTVVASFISSATDVGKAYDQELASEIVSTFLEELLQVLARGETAAAINLNRQEVIHRAQAAALQEQNNKIDLILETIQSEHQVAFNDVVERQSRDAALHAKIDAARDLLTSHQLSSALSILKSLKAELSHEATSADVKFRIHVNLGGALLEESNEVDSAIEHFIAARALKPGDLRAHTNLALAYVKANRPHQALDTAREVLSIDAHNAAASEALLAAYDELNDLEAICDHIREDFQRLEQFPLLARLGIAYANRKRYSSAVMAYEEALTVKPDSPELKNLLASSLVAPIRGRYMFEGPLQWLIPEEVTESLDRAYRLQTEAISEFRAQNNTYGLIHALSNRSASSAIRGNSNDARDDCREILRLDSNHVGARWNLALLELQEQRPKETLKLLSELDLKESEDEILLHKIVAARAHFSLGDNGRAIETLLPYFQDDLEQTNQRELAELITRGYLGEGRCDEANAFLDRIPECQSDHPWRLYLKALVINERRQPHEAINYLQCARDKSTGVMRQRIEYDLGAIALANGEYAVSADAFEKLDGENPRSEVFADYVFSIYKIGRLDEALDLAGRARNLGVESSMVLRIEGAILEYVGEINAAIEVWLQVASHKDAREEALTHIAHLELRRRDPQGALEALSQIEPDKVKASDLGANLIRIAQQLEYESLIPFAYRLTRSMPDSVEVRALFCMAVSSAPGSMAALANPETVGPGVVVRVHGDRGVDELLEIVPQGIDAQSYAERTENDDLVKLLSGHQQNDVVNVDINGEQVDLKIQALDNFYRYKAAKWMSELSSPLVENKVFKRMELQGDDLEPFLAELDRQTEAFQSIRDLYRNNQLPVGVIANHLGVTTGEMWARLMAHSDGFVRASSGHDDQDDRPDYQAPWVLDLTTILAFHRLGVLELMLATGVPLVVSRTTVDHLQGLESAVRGTRRAALSLEKQGDQYVRVPVDSGAVEREADELAAVLELIDLHMEVKSEQAKLEFAQHQLSEYDEIFGSGVLSTIMVAVELSGVMICDDFVSRKVAESEFGIKTSWTLPVIGALKDGGHLDESQCTKASMALVLSNYYFVSLAPNQIYSLMEKEKFQVTWATRKILRQLGAQYTEQRSAAYVFSELAKLIWLSSLSLKEKTELVQVAKDSFLLGRAKGNALADMEKSLERAFILLPIHLDQILEVIKRAPDILVASDGVSSLRH